MNRMYNFSLPTGCPSSPSLDRTWTGCTLPLPSSDRGMVPPPTLPRPTLPPPMDRQNTCENITFPRTIYVVGKNYLKHYKSILLQDRLRPGEYIPPKKMIEFSRKHQEEKLVKEQEDELRQLTEDEVDLEVRRKYKFILMIFIMCGIRCIRTCFVRTYSFHTKAKKN